MNILRKFKSRLILTNKFLIIKLLNVIYSFYFQKKDKEHNQKTFEKIQLNNSISIFHQNKKKRYNPNSSLHYDIFYALAPKFKNKKINILEIGTFEGEFTNFLANEFPDANIYTLDLPLNDKNFKETYNRNDNQKLKEHLNLRKKNLLSDNIFFYELDSLNLMSKFKDKKFDIIWIDGDHHSPQVQIDIFQAIKLSSLGTIILVDDIIKKKYSSKYTSNASFKTIEYLKKKKYLSTEYFIKRINSDNLIVKKYISYSVVNKLI